MDIDNVEITQNNSSTSTDDQANATSAGDTATFATMANVTLTNQQDPISKFTKLLRVVKTRVQMMEGYVRQRPHMLKKLSSEVVTEISALQIQLDELDLSDVEKKAFKDDLNEAQENAMMYFDASCGLDNETLTVNLTPGEAPDNLFKLKGCKPPVFGGNVREFQQWKQHFVAAVHNNQNLKNDHRMVHLLSCTRSTAREFLRAYPAVGTSYQLAFEALCKRFGDPTKLAQTFYADLANLPELYDLDETYVSLKFERENFDAIKTIVLNLQTCGSFDTELVQGWVLKKMKRSRCQAVFESLLDKYPQMNFSLSTLMDKLEGAIYANEVLELRIASVKKVTPEVESTEETESFTTLINKARATAAKKAVKRSLPPKASDRKTSQPLNCIFCDGKHASVKCRNYVSLTARRNRLEDVGRCVTCLSKAHRTNRCDARDIECRTCNKPGHNSITCLKTIKKVEDNRRPTTSRNRVRSDERNRSPAEKRPRRDEKEGNADSRKQRETGTFLETFLTLVEIDGKRTLVRGILDTGSNVSYVHKDVLQRLEIRLYKKFVISVQGIGSTESTPVSSGKIKVTFLGQKNQHLCCNLFTTHHIIGNSNLTPPPEEASAILPYYIEYADPDIFNRDPRPIEILLGNDVRNMFVKINRDKKLSNGLILKPTIFGWIPSGRALYREEESSFRTSAVSSVETKASTSETSEITLLWDLEVLGIRSSELDETENLIIEQFRKTTRFENDRYVVSWPRRTEVLNLPTHYRMCVARLKSLLNSTDREVLQQCNETFVEQLEKGVIEEAPRYSRYDTHYIPHKPVIKEGKPPRIVYDASAKSKSAPSLNDLLHRGPSLTGDLVGILLNFRLREIAVTSDIEKAFLQVGLDIADRDLVRFLWVKDLTRPVANDNIIVYRFTRTPFGVVSSPYLLNMVLQEHFSEGNNVWYRFARDRFYVDNFVASVNSVVDAVNLYESLTEHLARASFNLRDWTSNSTEFINALSPESEMKENPIKILGISWDRKLDTLSLKFKDEDENSPITLRAALSALQAVYDPLGLCAPCILDLKLYIQECWKIKATWDEKLPVSMEKEYRKLIVERNSIREIKFPRYLWTSKSEEGSYELHCFCDASKKAYGCAIFLLHKNRVKTEARLLYTKQRISPIQGRSIPQLELMATLVGKRASTFVRNKIDLTVTKTVVWTDATTVIQWLHSDKIQPQFVQNRLNELRRSPNLVIKHTPTHDNVADILTRGQRAHALQDNSLWWRGPEWLTQERLWPQPPPNTPEFCTASTSLVTLTNTISIPHLYHS